MSPLKQETVFQRTSLYSETRGAQEAALVLAELEPKQEPLTYSEPIGTTNPLESAPVHPIKEVVKQVVELEAPVFSNEGVASPPTKDSEEAIITSLTEIHGAIEAGDIKKLDEEKPELDALEVLEQDPILQKYMNIIKEKKLEVRIIFYNRNDCFILNTRSIF